MKIKKLKKINCDYDGQIEISKLIPNPLNEMLYGTALAGTAVHGGSDHTLGATYQAFFIGVGGDVSLDMATSGTNIVFKNLASGQMLPVQATVVNATNTTATNIAGVNSFAERYRVVSADPTTSLDEGDLAYNTTANALKYYDGTTWNAITSDTDVKVGVTSNDTTPSYLGVKLAAGSGISLSTLNPGGNEQIQITSSADAGGTAVAMAIALGG